MHILMENCTREAEYWWYNLFNTIFCTFSLSPVRVWKTFILNMCPRIKMCLCSTDSTPADYEHSLKHCAEFPHSAAAWFVLIPLLTVTADKGVGGVRGRPVGGVYYSCSAFHSKYKNCLWYRHKGEVELSEQDECWVKACEAVRGRSKLRKEREK